MSRARFAGADNELEDKEKGSAGGTDVDSWRDVEHRIYTMDPVTGGALWDDRGSMVGCVRFGEYMPTKILELEWLDGS